MGWESSPLVAELSMVLAFGLCDDSALFVEACPGIATAFETSLTPESILTRLVLAFLELLRLWLGSLSGIAT
jgi:hypothetical protein